MRVAIVGGTGFVGGYLTDALLASGYSVSMLVRHGSENRLRNPQQIQTETGDINDKASMCRLFADCDAVIYNVGILREVPRKGITFERAQYDGLVNAVNAALSVGVKRLLLMSANGAKKPGTKYQETKQRAEEYALNSGLDVTVFRPSVIFGDPRGTMEFATQLFNEMVRPPVPAVNFLPSRDSEQGAIVLSPIHVDDVVRAFLSALKNHECVGRTYALGGPEILTWKEIISRVAAAAARRKWFLPMPLAVLRIGATLFDWLPQFPVTQEQLIMLEEGNVADPAIMKALTGRELTSFSVENLSYLAT